MKTTNLKNIEVIFPLPPMHMVGDGFKMHNYIPNYFNRDMSAMDPFLIMEYNALSHVEPSDTPKGVGCHPHRGFETVTISYKGSVEHHDSAGNGGIIHEGDVQWMTAGKGVLHKEFHEEEFSKKGGEFQMVQIWVNLPAKDKMTKPRYQTITRDKVNKAILKDNGGTVEIIAGEYDGITGSAKTFSPVNLYNVRMNKNGKADFNIPANYNTALLVIEGEITVNGKETISSSEFAKFENKGEIFNIEAPEDAVVLIMSGEPIKEPIAHYGPFVMNTKEEIMEAYHDFNTGKFGYLEDETEKEA